MANEKILIIEDEGTVRTMLTSKLQSVGYQVFEADDGDSGYQIAQSMRPDLIISDILMPQMDGNQLMKKLKESPFGKDIPFIILSARSQMQDYFELMEVDDFIVKPFDMTDLLERIEKVLNKYRQKLSDDNLIEKKRILIFDDEDKPYQEFRTILMEHHYEVNQAKTLDECLREANLIKPDIVALRFLLNRVSGDKLVTALKEMPPLTSVPMVVYSRKDRGWEEKIVCDAGATSFVGEVTNEKLLKAIEKKVR